jgi:hypothetical protein
MRLRFLILSAGLALAACVPPVVPSPEPPTEPPTEAEGPGPMEPLFSFVIIADPHVAGGATNAARLEVAVDWINDNAVDRDIELVAVVGDIGWGAGLQQSRDVLDVLEPSWVPIIGDNVLASGEDATWDAMFGSQLDALGDQLDGWARAPVPVQDDRIPGDAWLQNNRFEHEGVLFVGVDWNIRHLSGALAEFGNFNDVPGGSWEWLLGELDGVEERLDESVVLLSHVPMLTPLFYVADIETFDSLVQPIASKFYGNFAGHIHINHDEEFPEAGYHTHVTDATWDDNLSIRLVNVTGNEVERAYEQQLLILEE